MFWLLNLIGLAAIGSNLAAGDGRNDDKPAPVTALRSPDKLMREGARLESRVMIVRSSGDSLTLEAEDDKQAFEALENLALERILQSVRADSNDKRWLVTGQVTEYRGRNFLMLERVTRAPKLGQ